MTTPTGRLVAAIMQSASGFDQLSKTIRQLSQSMAEAAKHFEENRAKLRDAVVDAIGQGLPETIAAREAGVARQTVRDWVGKPKRGDIVTAISYYGDEEVQGPYVPRTDRLAARPPADAAWVDDGSEQGPMMVKASTVRIVAA